MVDPMFIIDKSLRSFLTAVTPTAVALIAVIFTCIYLILPEFIRVYLNLQEFYWIYLNFRGVFFLAPPPLNLTKSQANFKFLDTLYLNFIEFT